MHDLTADSLESRCSAHASVAERGRFADGTLFGDWRLTAFIGRGGNGEVYCAEHTKLGTPAAVKVIVRDDERAKVRFEREAKLLSKLHSAAFPRFFAYGEENGVPYLAMELLEPGEMPTGDSAVAKFMLKICHAVAELHTLGYVHRDIKPGNILWRPRSRVPRDRGHAGRASLPVLADLGLVKEISAPNHLTTKPPNHLTTQGGVGTPGYSAPEQMERGEATEAADIHALGVLADHCFGGNPPRAWKRIIERATSSIPARRYPSVSALARAIRHRHLIWYAAGLAAALLAMMLTSNILPQSAGTQIEPQANQVEPTANAAEEAQSTNTVLDGSATIDGMAADDAKWFIDDLPVDMPHHFVHLPRSNPDWAPRRLCAVVQRNGKTYSAKRTDIVPKNWTGVRKLSLALKEDPPDGTTIKIYAHDGTPFEFAWCAPRDVAKDGAGFWIATKRLSGRQFDAIIKGHPHLGSQYFHPFRHDAESDFSATFGFIGGGTVPGVSSLDGSGFSLEPPDIRQWRLGKRLFSDFYAEMPEWAGVPPSQKDDDRSNGGWMRMDGSGREEYIDNYGWSDKKRLSPACVRYIGVSIFSHETNTVLFCTASSLLRSSAAADVARGEAMMKGFFQSDDMALRMKAMEVTVERGISSLEDFGGTNANVKLRFAAVRHGDSHTLERLAVDDPDPDVREEAYKSIANPPQMVSARYIAQIRAEDDPGDLSKPLKVIQSLNDRPALEFIASNAQLDFFRDEASARLKSLSGK